MKNYCIYIRTRHYLRQFSNEKPPFGVSTKLAIAEPVDSHGLHKYVVFRFFLNIIAPLPSCEIVSIILTQVEPLKTIHFFQIIRE